jgi:hypothetical protein
MTYAITQLIRAIRWLQSVDDPPPGGTTALSAEQVELIRRPFRAEAALFDAAGGSIQARVRASVARSRA